MNTNLPRHMPALDGLRGVAILMVVFTHAWGGVQAAHALPDWLHVIGGHAFHGVQLFFVVSAFTLTIQAGRRDDGWLAYAVRRLARIGPGYWLAGGAYTLSVALGWHPWAPNGTAPADIGIAAVFGSAWQGGDAMDVVPGGWSVSCEVAFYAVLPLLLWLIAGRLWRAVLLAAASALGVQMLARWHLMHGGWHYVPEYVNPVVQAPVFLAGIAAAMLAQRVRLPHLPGAALALLALGALGVPFLPGAVPEWYVLPHLPFAALIAGAVLLSAQRPPALLASAVMRRVGEVSYSLYLVHFALLAPCLAAAEWLLPGNGWATLALHFALVAGTGFGAASVSYRWVEQPCIRWAAGLLRARRPAAMAAE